MRHDRDDKPGVSNLIEIYARSPARRSPAVEQSSSGWQYGAFKGAVADAVVECLRPVQERYAELADDPAEVDAARRGRAAPRSPTVIARAALGCSPAYAVRAGLLRRLPGVGLRSRPGNSAAADFAEVLAGESSRLTRQRAQHDGLHRRSPRRRRRRRCRAAVNWSSVGRGYYAPFWSYCSLKYFAVCFRRRTSARVLHAAAYVIDEPVDRAVHSTRLV